MISLSYSCTKCAFATGMLVDAQEHADFADHTLNVRGSLTSSRPRVAPVVRTATKSERPKRPKKQQSTKMSAAARAAFEKAVLARARREGWAI
jgi:hypothetical protein